MIYFDNAATTFPKPPQVVSAMKKALTDYGANPGRAGHAMSMKTAETVYDSREKCADFFGAKAENAVFTLNCTHAVNTAVKGLISPQTDSHFVISDLEHNAVLRPVHAMSKNNGFTYSVAKTYDDDALTLKSFESLINAKTKAVVCMAASNVTGRVLPYRQIGTLCQKLGICFILDAAQGGGILPIKLSDGINFICVSGHKSLYGVMGTGLLITDGKYRLRPLTEGGTGSKSNSLEQPDDLPDRFESGTVNTPGIIALGAGIDFINKTGVEHIRAHETGLCQLFIESLQNEKRVKFYADRLADFDKRVPLVSFNIDGLQSAETAGMLSDAGFALRGGLHCSSLAHKKMNTSETGTVRFAPSVFNTKREVLLLVREVKRL
ncbi:MAG: aminotransferase class V-fold PLP-dependent enzyme [Oscillospiraceae bacterium]|nr:aminotransferase class V-fold PLP-dependent enzyme [Oscillospiraceae bacterium]